MEKTHVLLPIYIAAIISMTSCLSRNNATPAVEQPAEASVVVAAKSAEVVPTAPDEVEGALHRDINSDGVVDSIFVSQDGGSMSGGTYLRIVNGKTNREYLADNDDYNGAVIGVCAFDESNNAFATIAREHLLPQEQRQRLDPVAEWVVNSLKARRKITGQPLLLFMSKPQLQWLDSLVIPKTYCVKINQQTARSIVKSRRGCSDDYDGSLEFVFNRGNAVWLTVHADYRFRKELKVVYDTDGVKVHANNHCVAIERGGKFAWVFVNDCFWTGKATSVGIDSLEVSDGVIWVVCGGFERFMIDLNSGKIVNYYFEDGMDMENEDLISRFKKQ